jgi:ketosteroid isomerase-like protein
VESFTMESRRMFPSATTPRLATLVFGLWLCAGAALAQPGDGAAGVMATITRMTDAVNRGAMPTAFAAFTASPWITEDGPPYVWRGPGAPKAWIESMGANAQANGISGVDMKLSPASRIEVTGDRAYALVPGRLTYTLKDGNSAHADGLLTFTLQRTGPDWRIETLIWSGPVAKP